MKVVNVTALIVAFTAIVMMGISSAIGTTTGDLIISGVVDPVFAIDVTADSAASNLDIEAGESATTVASVNEQSNNPTGYKITVSSDNAGRLVHGSVASSFVNYTLSYDGGTAFQPSASPTTVKTVSSLSTPADSDSNVTVTFTGLSTAAVAGTYSDRVEFEISAP